MEQHIDQVIAVGLQPAPLEVQVPVGQHCKGAVGLVAFLAGHESTPKVVLEEIPEGGFAGIEVIVGENASVVVKYESSVQGAPVAGEGDCKYHRGGEQQGVFRPHLCIVGWKRGEELVPQAPAQTLCACVAKMLTQHTTLPLLLSPFVLLFSLAVLGLLPALRCVEGVQGEREI